MEIVRVLFVVLTVYIVPTSGYKSLQRRIPNGARVPDPCNPSNLWGGVGHLKPKGYGKRNQFGLDFKKHDLKWSKAFCMLDSDDDGRTNGQELGDPDCTWTAGTMMNIATVNVTHPGICEPLQSSHCRRINTWLKCDDTDFKCEAITRPDTQNVTVRFPNLKVPAQQTTHYCMVFYFPQNGDFHMVATQPFIDNRKVVHHVQFYGCDETKEPKKKTGVPYECELAPDPACVDLLSVWLLGAEAECAHENAGFRIGSKGYKRGWLQVHWENQDLSLNETDSSGTTIFYSSDVRMGDAGILVVGQDHVTIPPGETRHQEVGVCPSTCTKRKFSEDIHVVSAVNHMHYLGVAMSLEHIRDGKVIHVLTNETTYMFDSPTAYRFKEPIIVRPSDEIRTTCTFNSKSRVNVTRSGTGYLEEMCYGFLTFYPKKAISAGPPACTSWRSLSACRFQLDGEVNGCDLKNAHNISNPATEQILDRVLRHCRPRHTCYKECYEIVNETSENACFRGHGDIWSWSHDKYLSPENDDKTGWSLFYQAFDTCAKDNSNHNSTRPDDLRNVGTRNMIVNSLTLLSMLLIITCY